MSCQNNAATYAQCPAQSVGMTNTLVSTLVQALLVAQCAISPPEYWPPDYAETALKQGLGEYDFIVVGAGSAGSVVASRLSEFPDWRILVLEAGGDPPQESEVPLLFFSLQHSDEFNWNYYTEPTGKACRAVHNEVCYWPRGKFIGGTGGINAMLYIRGNRQDYDGWAQLGNDGWGYDDVLPYFEKSVRPVGNETHPLGYVALNEFPQYGEDEIIQMIYDGVAELGLRKVVRFEEGSESGYTNVPGTISNGQRMSSGKGHLGRVSARSNLHVIKNAQVTRINFDASGEFVKSVSFVLRGTHKMEAKVKQELVLSAGTIDTAKLLLLSGVGPRTHLQNLQIPVVHDLRIGDNLQDHLMTPIFFKLHTSTAVPASEKEMLDTIYNYLIHGRGPLSSHGTASLTGFVNTLEGSQSPYPDVEYHHFYSRRGDQEALRLWLNGHGYQERYKEYLLDILNTSSVMTVFAAVSRPKSIGNLRLRSADPKDKPKLFAGYLEEREDVETLLRAIRFLMKVEQTRTFRDNEAEIVHIPIDECDALTFKTDEYWSCYVKYFTGTVYHQTGTVKMGPSDDPTACVDPRLRLYGVRNLRVADASIMPNIPSANVNAATLMIGEKAADFIKEERGGDREKFYKDEL